MNPNIVRRSIAAAGLLAALAYTGSAIAQKPPGNLDDAILSGKVVHVIPEAVVYDCTNPGQYHVIIKGARTLYVIYGPDSVEDCRKVAQFARDAQAFEHPITAEGEPLDFIYFIAKTLK